MDNRKRLETFEIDQLSNIDDTTITKLQWAVLSSITDTSPVPDNLTIDTLTLESTTDATNSSIGGSLTVAGGAAIKKKLFVGTSVSSPTLISTVSTGTSPLTVSSTTNVANLNASSLSGATFASPGAIGTGSPNSGAFTTINASGIITSSLANGTSPFTLTSSTVVPNLNSSLLLGKTWAIPNPIGSTTPNSSAFTTISASGQITSTLANGTAPLVVSSSTNVANLNSSTLNGNTFAIPSSIGSTTPNTGAFTTISSTGIITSTLADGTSPFTLTSSTVVPNLNSSLLLGKTWAIPNPIGSSTPNTGAFSSLTSISLTVSGGKTTHNGDMTGAVDGLGNGKIFAVDPLTFTDSSTAGSGTNPLFSFNSFNAPTLAATNSLVTTTTAATLSLYAPIAGTNQTITNPYALYLGSGKLKITNSAASTSNSTGSLLMDGGIGITKTTDATDSTNGGSFSTAGGLAVAKKIFAGTSVSSPTLISTVSTGTSPLTITSTTNVANLNSSTLNGSTFAIPSSIGSTTPNSGAFTTLSSTGQITSTLSTGTAPLVIASTTNVANLNSSTLNGNTFAIPSSIGSTTPNTGAFTTLSCTTITAGHINAGITFTVTAAGTTTLDVSSTQKQYFNGSTTQTVTLPVASTLVLGYEFLIGNMSSASVTVNSSGGNLVATVNANSRKSIVCVAITGTDASSWSSI